MDNLLDSARMFLIESLNNYHARDKISFSIVHAIVAVELLLKERLSRIHENLIYENIDIENIKNQNTVKLSIIPKRLKNLGVKLNNTDCDLIKKVSKWRHAIIHHLPTHNTQSAKAKLEQLYNFIISFLVNELNEKFHDFLPKNHYQSMEKIIDELNKEISKAKQKAQESGHPDMQQYCPLCFITGVVEILNEDRAYCHLCTTELRTAICAECEKHLHTYQTDSSIAEKEYCQNCIEAAGELYIEHLIDLARGK